MALNWEAIRKQNAATGRKIPIATKPTVSTPTKPSYVPTKTSGTKSVTVRGKTVAPVNDRTRYNEATRTGFADAIQNNAGARAFAGFQQGLSLIDLEKSMGEQYGQETLDALQGSKAYTAGEVGGMISQFAGGYGAAAPKIGSALAKVPAFAKMGKVGQGVARSVATDFAVGLPLNTNIAYNKEGLQGDDALKNIALNTAIDLVAGGVLETIGGLILKNGKRIRNKDDLLKLSAPEQQEAVLLLSEGINWQQGTRPTLQLPEPRMYVDAQGGTGFNPPNQIVPRQTEAPFIASRDELLFTPKATRTTSGRLSMPIKGATQGVQTDAQRVFATSNTIVPLAENTPLKSAGNITPASTKKALPNKHKEVARLVREFYDNKSLSANEYIRSSIGVNEHSFAAYLGITPAEAKGMLDSALYNSGLLKHTGTSYSLSKKGALEFPKKSQLNKNTVLPEQKFKDLGADVPRIYKQTDQLVDEYGAFPQGMQPALDGRPIPKATDMGEVQQGMRTIAEAPTVNAESYKEITTAIEEGSAWKPTIINETVVNKANDTIAKDGLDVAYGKFSAVLSEGRQAKSEDIALGYRLLQEYQAQGNYKRVADIAVDVSEMLSESGRSLQAARIIKQLTPEGRLMSVQRVADRLSERYGRKIILDDETLQRVLRAIEEGDIIRSMEAAGKAIWNQIPSGFQNKVNAWRYMSMLMNPKTHVRNIVGNAIFLPFRELKNLYGIPLEKAFRVPVGQRTKAIVNPIKDKALFDIANKDFDVIMPILRGEGKLDDQYRKLTASVFGKGNVSDAFEGAVGVRQKIKAGSQAIKDGNKNPLNLGAEALEAARRFNLYSLDAEDVIFMRLAYDSSFAQFLKANKIDVTQGIEAKVISQARSYASNEALKATYRDTNTVATAISKLKKKLATEPSESFTGLVAKRAGGAAIEGVLPFTKTPINILRRGVEYSPYSLLTGTGDLIRATKVKGVAKRGVAISKALDRLAAGMSGTSVLLLGLLLGKNKIVVGGNEEPWNSKKTQFDKLRGMQEYAIDTGEGTYVIDWAAPMSMPFFVGVEMSKMADEGADFAKIVDALTAIDDPFMNMSMLQSLNDSLRSYNSDDGFGGALGEIGLNMLTSYVGQFVPTVGGQIARTADDTRRTTTSTGESAFVRKMEKTLRKQQGKIPGQNQKLEPYINLWGETESSGTAFGNFLNPGYYKEKSDSKLDAEIARLVSASDEGSKAIPRQMSGYTLEADKKSYRLTEKELTKFKQVQGKESKKGAEALIRSSAYRGMSDEAKAKALDKVYSDAFQTAKWTILKQRSVFPNKN